MATKTERRAKEILHQLLQHGKTSVEELADQFATSSASIRRDLVRLEREGLVHRTRGGAMLAGQTYEPFRFDATFAEREHRFIEEKRLIAARTAALIGAGETIGLTAGTTTTEVARALRSRTDLHIVTNAVNIGMELSSNERLEVTMTGGAFRWPGAFSLVGPMALEALNVVLLDKLVLGVCGIDSVHGATTIESEEAAIFRAMSRRAREVIIVADSSKLGMTSPAVICPTGAISTLITDAGAAAATVRAFERAGVEVIIAAEGVSSGELTQRGEDLPI